MKIIDLLNKIANGEEVPKIKYKNIEYVYEDVGYYSKQRGYLFDGYYVDGILNDEVEILDEPKEDKIQKIYHCETSLTQNEVEIFITQNLNLMVDKINELIDEINKLKEK